jgi:hypothetical protein
MKMVGYNLSGQDNDTHMFRDNSIVAKCEACGYRLDFLRTNPNYVLRGSKRDLSATYDGQTIVSKAFKEFCERNEYRGLKFAIFENDPDHFHLILTRVVKFDAAKRKTRFDKLCPECGNYESVVGATPSFLLVSDPLKDGFYRTDLLFGSGNEKHPLELVGTATKAKLEAAKLKGLEFKPAYGIGTEVSDVIRAR